MGLEVQPGGDMTELEQVIVVEYSLLDENVPDVSGSGSVSIWNTFEEVEGTGGLETIYSYSESTISDDVEFSLFPPNPPDAPEGGFYDIDISLDEMDASKGTITWTLKDNLGAGHLVVGVGSFDRYYVIFDQDVVSASLVESASLNPKVSVPYYEEKNDILDLFGSGLPFPSVLDSKVILLEVRPGGDMTELEQVEPDVTIFNTFQEQDKTGGLETIYAYSEATISDGNEFSLFPQNPPGTPEGGFYNIDVSPDSMDAMMGTITWTLKDNLCAGHLVLPEGSFDRYYITFLNKSIASASITSSTNLNPKVSVPLYEEKNEMQDFFGSGLSFPPILGNNVVLLEVQPGGDMTELEQVIVVEYSLLDENVPDVSGSGSVSIWNT